MTQQNLRELLKQGDPKAIASSINRTLKPKGINADVTRDDGCLHIILESDKVPSQMALVDFIRSGMTNLGVESIHTVKVYGRRTGDGSAAWEDEIELMPSEPMYASDNQMPDDSIGLDDVEPEGQDYYQEEEFDRDHDNDNEEDEDEDFLNPDEPLFGEGEEHPLQVKAQELAMRAMDLIGKDAGAETPSYYLVSNLLQVSGKLAGVLHRDSCGDEPETGFVLAVLKRCLGWLNEAMGACQSLIETEEDHDQRAAFEHLRDSTFEVRAGIIKLRQELK